MNAFDAVAIVACAVHHPHLDAAERAALGVALAALKQLAYGPADGEGPVPPGVFEILRAVSVTIDATEGAADVATAIDLVVKFLDGDEDPPTMCVEIAAVSP